MADPFVGQIDIFAFNFPPKGWAFCNGQLLPISQNTALFSLLGTNFGGDGRSTFGLPNLQGCVPVHCGNSQGPGLAPYDLGQTGGEATVTLLPSQLPAHGHTLPVSAVHGAINNPTAATVLGAVGSRSSPGKAYTATASNTNMANASSTGTGGNGAHNNMAPYLAVSFCIALQGVFPARN